MLVAVSTSALMAFAGISSGPAAFPFLSVMMAFVGLSQLMDSSVSAGGMSGGVLGAERLSSSLKCSAHRFSCSSVVLSGSPSLSFTGLSVCWNLPDSFLVTRYRSLRCPCPGGSPVRLLPLPDGPGFRCNLFCSS